MTLHGKSLAAGSGCVGFPPLALRRQSRQRHLVPVTLLLQGRRAGAVRCLCPCRRLTPHPRVAVQSRARVSFAPDGGALVAIIITFKASISLASSSMFSSGSMAPFASASSRFTSSSVGSVSCDFRCTPLTAAPCRPKQATPSGGLMICPGLRCPMVSRLAGQTYVKTSSKGRVGPYN